MKGGQRKAYCTIKYEPQYRRKAFEAGLTAAGYEVMPQHTLDAGRPGDLLVIWNRYGGLHDWALKFERNGGTVLVVENGYMANDRFDRTRYAIAKSGHNGQGAPLWLPVLQTPGRFEQLGLQVNPWRTAGTHVLVTPNRSFGRPGHIMANDWPTDVVRRLKLWTKRPIRVRMHPGENVPKVPLQDDLRDCWAMVTWYSSSGIDALLAGVPVFFEAPCWVAQTAGFRGIQDIENPPLAEADRLKALTEVAWAQWHVEEIALGTPFQHLRD